MESAYTLQQIAAEAGVSVATIRYYITQGAVPRNYGSRSNPVWTDDHLRAVMRVRRALTTENKKVTDHRPRPHCPKVDRRDH